MTCKEERKKIYYRYIDRKNFKNVMTFRGVLVHRKGINKNETRKI